MISFYRKDFGEYSRLEKKHMNYFEELFENQTKIIVDGFAIDAKELGFNPEDWDYDLNNDSFSFNFTEESAEDEFEPLDDGFNSMVNNE